MRVSLKENSKTFGQLVESIREELKFVFRGEYTQEDLAEKINILSEYEKPILDGNKISLIERGESKTITLKRLTFLAQALRLTMRERREFFAAALGVTTWAGANDLPNPDLQLIKSEAPELLLARYRDYVQQQSFPCFVTDQYLNVLFANSSILSMFFFTPELIETDRNTPFAYNLMHMLFSDTKEAEERRKFLGDSRRKISLRNVHLFRTATLRYRHTAYYKQLQQHLMNYSEFYWFWQKSFDSRELAKFPGITEGYDVRGYQDQEPSGMQLAYASTLSSALSKYGDLYITVYIPLNEHTNDTFRKIRANSEFNAVESFANWEMISQ